MARIYWVGYGLNPKKKTGLIRARRRLRVVTLLDKPDITGGGERMAVTLAMRLDPTRFESILCATRQSAGATFENELVDAGVRMVKLDRGSKLDLLLAPSRFNASP